MKTESTTPISDQLRDGVVSALERGETQSSLARRSGVPQSKISDWLAGKATMTLVTADKLAVACDAVACDAVACDAGACREKDLK